MDNIVSDVGAPVLVAAVNIGTQSMTTPILGQPAQRMINYGMTLVGYAAAFTGMGGGANEFLKNVGIASAPGTLVGLYNQLVKPTTAASISKVSRMSRVSRYPAPAQESPFQGVKLV
jgi:hypothetical protein